MSLFIAVFFLYFQHSCCFTVYFQNVFSLFLSGKKEIIEGERERKQQTLARTSEHSLNHLCLLRSHGWNKVELPITPCDVPKDILIILQRRTLSHSRFALIAFSFFALSNLEYSFITPPSNLDWKFQFKGNAISNYSLSIHLFLIQNYIFSDCPCSSPHLLKYP